MISRYNLIWLQQKLFFYVGTELTKRMCCENSTCLVILVTSLLNMKTSKSGYYIIFLILKVASNKVLEFFFYQKWMFVKQKFRLNYSFGPFICHKISVWSSSFLLSQFGPHFLKNDSIWSSPLTLTKRC